jgi:hypothetical protein
VSSEECQTLTGNAEEISLNRRISPEGIMSKRCWIAATLMIVAIGMAGCAGMSDEERCKRDGGVWKSRACEMQTK